VYPSQLGPHSLQPILHILQRLGRGLPRIKLPQQLVRLGRQLRLHKVLFQQAAHHPRQGIRIRRREGLELLDVARVPRDRSRLERVRDRQVIYLVVVVEARVALASIETPCQRDGQLPDEAVVRDSEVAELEGEAYEVGDEVRGVDSAVDEDGSVDVRVIGG
jgi:hypothetical protein